MTTAAESAGVSRANPLPPDQAGKAVQSRDSARSFYDEYTETMSRENIQRLQEARLLRLLPYVYERSALIRHVWDQAGVKPSDIRSLDDFREKAPFMDKGIIQEFREKTGDPTGGLCCVGAPRLRGIGFTSGTTGDPLPMPRGDFHLVDLMVRRDYWQMGARPGDYIASMQFTYRRGQHGDRFAQVGLIPICFEHHTRELPALIEASLKYRPSVLHMVSTPILLGLERLVNESGIDPVDLFLSYKGAVFGGEPLSSRLHTLVRSWGLEIFEYTSVGDVMGAMECSAHDGMHAWEDAVLVEFLRPGTNEPVADGERGELVVTSLMDDIAPLIRYRSEDLVSFNTGRCSCGRSHVRFKPIGRAYDEFRIDGRSILPRDILVVTEQVRETSSGLFQIVKKSTQPGTLTLRIGYEPELLKSDEGELIARLEDTLREHLNVEVIVELRTNTELLLLGPPHKIPRMVKE